MPYDPNLKDPDLRNYVNLPAYPEEACIGTLVQVHVSEEEQLKEEEGDILGQDDSNNANEQAEEGPVNDVEDDEKAEPSQQRREEQ